MRHSLAILFAVVVIAVLALPTVVAQQADQADVQLKDAIKKEVVDGDLKGAIAEFQRVVNTPGVSRAVAATALVHLGQCHEKLGNAEAQRAYERVLKEYPDQADAVRQAKDRLATFAKADASAGEAAWGRRIVGPSNHLRVAVSPDGRYLTYCCAVSASMVIRDVASGRESTLPIETAGAPRFSPDGEGIAYVTQRAEGAPELRVLKRTGSDDRLLFQAPDVTTISLYDWMPDGKSLLVRLARADKTTEMALMSTAGGASRRIASPAPAAGGYTAGSLSPDGRYFAYRAQAPGAGSVWTTRVFDLDSGLDAPLVEHPANAWNAGWTADGRFAFYSAEAHSEGIWSVKVADGKAQGPPERTVGKLDDSIRAVGMTRRGEFFYQKDIVDLDIQIITIAAPSATTKPAQVLNNATAPSWSPDGRYLAYGQGRTGLIAIRTLATGATRTLWTGLPAVIMALQWYPDASALAVQGVGPDGSMASVGLRRVDLASGSLSDILLGPTWRQFGANPVFSGDAKTLTYKSFEASQGTSLTRHNLESRQHDLLLERKPPKFVSSFAVLPRTGQIAVAVQEGDGTCSIGVLDPPSRDVRVIHRTAKGEYIPATISLASMPDGQSLVFVSSPAATNGRPMSLFRIAASGGTPEKLFEAELIFQARVHPDGSRIALDTRSYRMETFLVDNLFAGAKK